MKLFKRIGLILLLALLAFIAYTFISTGFFRKIKPLNTDKVIATVKLKGAEDIMVSPSDSFLLVSSADRALYRDCGKMEGDLYYIDLREEGYKPISLTDSFKGTFAPHGISYYKKDSVYHLGVINHTEQGHTVELFQLIGKELSHIKTMEDPSMIQPNDIVMIDENRFYFTNDHGYTKGIRKLIEEYGGRAWSNVVYYDGKEFHEAARGIAYANGINYNAKRNLLFVSSPRKFLVKVYDVLAGGQLSFRENIPCGTGVDNIEFDREGNLWIGCHPSLLRFSAYAGGKKETAPSEVIKIAYKGKGDYMVESLYVEDGSTMSAASVSTPFGNRVFVGNVMDDQFLVLER